MGGRRLRKRLLRGAGFFTVGLVGAFALFWWWQPWEYDFVERKPKEPLPLLDPESSRLFNKGTRVMVVTAHPDDEVFYNGGTLTRLKEAGAEISFVLCTDGDKAYYGPFENSEENRQVRREETREVAAELGSEDVVFLGRPDGRLRNTEDLQQEIAREIERVNPDYLMTFDPEYPTRFSHSDHRRAGEAATAAASQSGFEGWLLLFSTMAPTYRVDITKHWDEKRKLLAMHRSQFFGERLERIENMVKGRAVEQGRALGVELAEGFRALRHP